MNGKGRKERWRRSERGSTGAPLFLPLAERSRSVVISTSASASQQCTYAQASAIATSEEWSSSSFRAILTNFKAEKKTNNVVRLAVQQLMG